jgi:predicted XRE-type DNA-binding protein
MSYLSIALTRFAEQSNLKQTDIGRISGLTRSHISRIFAGDQKTVTDDDFLALLRAYGKQAQAEIIAARCMDAKAGAAGTSAADLVEIRVKTPSGKHESPSEDADQQVQLAQETERAFAWLRSQCPVNPDLEKHLVGYAKLTGMK